jgi:hypothetical protein
MAEKKSNDKPAPGPAPSHHRPVPGSGQRTLDESSRSRPGTGQDSGGQIRSDPTVSFTPSTKPPPKPTK